MKTILVLGDCQSNGNNCLADEITGVEIPRTFSLHYHNNSTWRDHFLTDNFDLVFKWVLKQKDFPSCDVKELRSKVWQYIRTKEMARSWPALINDANVINLSVNGAHFLVHCFRLKKYLEHNPPPDLIIVTDYEFNHIAYTTKEKQIRHFFETVIEPNSDTVLENKPQKKIDRIKTRTKDRHLQMHKRSFKKLVDIMQAHKLKYSILRFGQFSISNQEKFDSFLNCDIDCKHVRRSYMVEDGDSEYGAELSKVKLEAQQLIANQVIKELNKYRVKETKREQIDKAMQAAFKDGVNLSGKETP